MLVQAFINESTLSIVSSDNQLRISSQELFFNYLMNLLDYLMIRDVEIILCSDVENFSLSETLLINFHRENFNAILVQAFFNKNTRSILS